MLTVTYADSHKLGTYAEHLYVESNVIMLSVIVLRVVAPFK
jgi:hypothetical protein